MSPLASGNERDNLNISPSTFVGQSGKILVVEALVENGDLLLVDSSLLRLCQRLSGKILEDQTIDPPGVRAET